MSAELLVALRGVGKSFPRIARRRERSRALLALLAGRAPPDQAVVLRDIDLEVRRGESVGIIGENGAGKSTLLKVLTGVLAPSSGSVTVNGSIAALLELGAGFHPEFTGSENIRMAGTLMGLSSNELAAKYDEIVAFADIGRYIDEPVKHYSTGMVVRLGFALVAARRPDLLITDEVLAVGDEAFQRKCIRWIEDYLGDGGTLLLVSHSMYHVQKICRRACWIHQGGVQAVGDVHRVTQEYLAFQERRIAVERDAVEQTTGGAEFQIDALQLNGAAQDHAASIAVDGELEVRLRIRARSSRVPLAGIGLLRADGTPVYGVVSDMDQAAPCESVDGMHTFIVRYPQLPLLPGAYQIRGLAYDPEGMRLFDVKECALIVRGETREMGMVRLPHIWTTPGPATGKPSA